MDLYLAAVGNDLWGNMENATQGSQMKVLASFFDVTPLAGFQFRRKAWENLTGEPVDIGKSLKETKS